jgi:uncharacterized protein (DUF2252 family)
MNAQMTRARVASAPVRSVRPARVNRSVRVQAVAPALAVRVSFLGEGERVIWDRERSLSPI